MIRVGIICGSINSDSMNEKLALAIAAQAPDTASVTLIDIANLPVYNKDLDADFPASANTFKTAVADMDGILFVTPEHNRSISAALKNAIDWASRPHGTSVWNGMPGATAGASPGSLGTAVGQYHLKQIMLHLGMRILSTPEFHLGHAQEKFNEQGALIDDETKKRINALWEAFVAHVRRYQ